MQEHLTITPLDSQSITHENLDDWKPGTGMITVRTVETAQIIADPAYQMRAAGTDEDVVEKYAVSAQTVSNHEERLLSTSKMSKM